MYRRLGVLDLLFYLNNLIYLKLEKKTIICITNLPQTFNFVYQNTHFMITCERCKHGNYLFLQITKLLGVSDGDII